MHEPSSAPSQDASTKSTPGHLRLFFGYGSEASLLQALRAALHRERWTADRTLIADEACAPASLDRVGVKALPRTEAGDLDLEALRRQRPSVLALSTISQRNSSSASHRRRFQELELLLDAGCQVWTTLHVRKLESKAELAESLTHLSAGDLVPDRFLDRADELDFIDPAAKGDAAVSQERASSAVENSSAKDLATLLALRELALRAVSERHVRRSQASPPPPYGSEEQGPPLLVCVGPSPSSARVIQAAYRLAQASRARWFALHIQGPHTEEGATLKVEENLLLAETLGAEIVILPARDIPSGVLSFAASRGIKRIVIGRTGPVGWRSRLGLSLVDQLLASSQGIEVSVIRGPQDDETAPWFPRARLPDWSQSLFGAALGLGLASLVAWLFRWLGLTDANLVLVYLLSVTATALWLGRAPAIVASFGAVILFNFFFTEPSFTLYVQDQQYLFTFLVMLIIGLLVSALAAAVREQKLEAARREAHTTQLYRFSQELSATSGRAPIAALAVARLREAIGGELSLLYPIRGEVLSFEGQGELELLENPQALRLARQLFEQGMNALPSAEPIDASGLFHVPIMTASGPVGLLSIRPRNAQALRQFEARRLLETFAAQIGLAMAREELSEDLRRLLARAEAEKLRSAVLSAVSHDFRSPLSTIVGASSSILAAPTLDLAEEQRALVQTIFEESKRLARLVENILNLTRLESGLQEPVKDWNLVEDLIGSALTRLKALLGTRQVLTRVPAELPLVRVDGLLIEQLLVNLLDNAAKYAPRGAIEIGARVEPQAVIVEVSDRGEGLSESDRGHLFEKFFRASNSRELGVPGAGLGLAICTAIARLHKGRLTALAREGGGLTFALELPREAQPPSLEEPKGE